MINLALIFHMHQPYYRDLRTGSSGLPWVRLHASKDYLDMVEILDDYPGIRLNFNLVPVLIEQLAEYAHGKGTDDFLVLSRTPAAALAQAEKNAIRAAFFLINLENVIVHIPRYYELYIKNLKGEAFTLRDYRDLQVWFNLAWIDPRYREQMPELSSLVRKGGNFTEEDKKTVLDAHSRLIKRILPAYRSFRGSKRIEIAVSPYAHPILPLLSAPVRPDQKDIYGLPTDFSYPEDIRGQLHEATALYQSVFGEPARGLWPSELSLSDEVIPYIADAGIRWLVSDEAILFKSLAVRDRDPQLLYQPHLLDRNGKDLSIIFRDRVLSDLIGFVYGKWNAQDAVDDFINRLQQIHALFPDGEPLVCVALDGENAWEYFRRDGWDFLSLLYRRLSESSFIRTTRVSDYLDLHPPRASIGALAAGSWIDAAFWKWNGTAQKNTAWKFLSRARRDYESCRHRLKGKRARLAYKQMLVCEGSDWFWWQGEDPTGEFDELFRAHLSNLYEFMGLPRPAYLSKPLA